MKVITKDFRLCVGKMCVILLALFLPVIAFAQSKVTISGTVYDEFQMPVISATVIVVGQTNMGAITDLDGNFTINDVPSDATIRISYVGYKTQEIPLNGQTQFTINLVPDSELLGEVVVTALGIKRSQKALSYNVQELKSESLNTVKDANFMNSLSGKVAGVNITKSSGGVGGATKVIMRGTKSIAGNNGVLYVVDGMPIGNQNLAGDGSDFGRPGSGEGISDFASEDIESISVLTGPSAAALYGAAAANGVIIINTKKGAEGSLKVNLSTNTEFLTPTLMPEFQNTYGTTPNTYFSWGEKLATPSTFDPADFFQTGYSTINSISLSGGTEKSQTYVSVTTTNSEGIIPNNEYYRYNFTGRNTANFLDDRLHTDFSASYVLQGDQNMMSGGRYFNPLRPLYLFPRGDDFQNVQLWERWNPGRQIYEQYWPYGDQGQDFENPYWIVNKEMFYTEKHRYMFNGRLQYDFADWINLAGRIRVDNTYNTTYQKFAATTRQLFTNDDPTKPMGNFTRSEGRFKQTYGDLMVNINKTWEEPELSLTANIGTSYEDYHTTGVSIGGPLNLIPNFFAAINVDPDKTGGGGDSYIRTKNVAAFYSAELGWKEMIYLSTTGRADWASQLVKNGKVDPIFYPSVGLSAVLSQMMKLPDWWTYLKVRGSFTEVGSPISMVGVTPGSITYSMDAAGVNPITIYPFPDFQPERTRSYEVGLNSRFFDGDLTLDATFYYSNTYNQTFLQELSASSGYSGFYIQAGNIRNRGVEAALNYSHTWGDFYFSSGLTYTFNQNKVLELAKGFQNPIDGTTFDIDELLSPKRMKVGDSMSDIFVQGILVKGPDGKLVEEGNTFKVDRTQVVKVGKTDPDFMMGWNNTFAWKGLSLSFLINGRFGGLASSATQMALDNFGVSKVTADARDLGYVLIDGEQYDPQRYYQTIGGNGLGAYYLYDATQIKLSELSLGYSFSKELLEKTGFIKNASVSLIGRNLLYIYRAAPFDTELSGGTGTYSGGGDNFMPPAQRSIGFSVKLGF